MELRPDTCWHRVDGWVTPEPRCFSFGLRAAGRRAEAWLQRGLPSSQQQCPPRDPYRFTTQGGAAMAKVFIGVDPHKLSATIEVVDDHETVLATGRFDTDQAGYAAMRETVSR